MYGRAARRGTPVSGLRAKRSASYAPPSMHPYTVHPYVLYKYKGDILPVYLPSHASYPFIYDRHPLFGEGRAATLSRE